MIHLNPIRCLLTITLAASAAGALEAQAASARPLAIRNARILTLAGEVIENGTVLVKNGKIKAVGDKVDVPAGAEVVDAQGGTVMPGLVHAFSLAGTGASSGRETAQMRRFRRRYGMPSQASRTPKNQASSKLADSLYARQDVFGELLEAGVTTLVVTPSGSGIPGNAVVVDPSVEYEEGFVLDDDVFLTVNPEAKAASKKLLKSALGSGKKALEDREKEAEEAKAKADAEAKAEKKPKADGEKPSKEPPKEGPKPDDEPAPKPEPKPDGGDEPKPGPKPKSGDAPKPAKGSDSKPTKKKPAKKKDPNAEVLADLLDGKRRAFVTVTSAREMLHFMDARGDYEFKTTVVTRQHAPWNGTLDRVIDELKELDASVLIVPELTSDLYSNAVYDPSARLREAGIEVGYLLGNSRQEIHELFFQLIELVRYGADPQDVLRGVTAVPAKLLGMSRQVGTIEAGKRADLLLFSGDPLDPTSKLLQVFHRGARVQAEVKR